MDTAQPSRIDNITEQSSSVVIDTTCPVNLNYIDGNTLDSTDVFNRTEIHAHIFPTDTAVLNRTKIQTPIFQPENNKPDMNSNMSFSEIANTIQDDDENYLSIAEIYETSIISNYSDLHSPLSTQIHSISASQPTPTFQVVSPLEDHEQVQEIVMDTTDSALYTDASANDCEHSTSTVLHSLTHDISNVPPIIMINETFCGDDNIERLNTSNRVDGHEQRYNL